MTKRILHPFLQKVAALIVLGVGLGAGVSAISYPLIEASSARAEAAVRLARYETMLNAPAADTAYDPSDLAATHIDDAEARLVLQARIDRLARDASVNLQSIQPMAAEYLGEIGRGVWIELTFTCDLQALTDFLTSLDAERPLLLVRRLEIERGDGLRPDLFLRIKADIGRAWQAMRAPT